MNTNSKLLLTLLLALVTIGCAGLNTFNKVARPNETVAVPLGFRHNINLDNIRVTITPDIGSVVTYLPGNPAIRTMTNMVVDPLSSIVVSRETSQDLTPSAQAYALSTKNLFTGDDKAWHQTVAFIDLPATFDPSASVATITVDDSGMGGAVTESVSMDVEILQEPGGLPHDFRAEILQGMTPAQLTSLRRVDHFTVSFTGSPVPAAIEVDLIHDTGVGVTHVVNPIGYIKNAAWSDDGTNLRVILTPARDGIITTMADFKFYVAGGITGLYIPVDGVQAFDIDGNPVTGISGSVD